jgi:uncharacterized protein (TIGR03435 family)
MPLRTIFAFSLLACALWGQAPTFETASIKPTPPDAQCGMIRNMPGGTLRIDCITLKGMLLYAYDVQDFQLLGGQGWVETERWNIMAKPGSGETPQEGPAEFEKMNDAQRRRAMEVGRLRLQALLAERFQVSLRHEKREQTVYALTVAKNGPKMKEAENQASAGFLRRGRGVIEGRGALMDTVAQFLAIDMRRPVTNETGLTKHYDFKLEWTPDSPVSSDGAAGTPAAVSAPGPTVFTALEEQMGLKLESRKGPVEMLIIERAERASEN